MITISANTKEIDDLARALLRKSQDLSAEMRDIADIMLDAIAENFEQEGRPKWTPLSKATANQKKGGKKRGYHPILNLSGGRGLLGSISADSDKLSAIVGTNKPYARIHQLGGKAGKNKKVTIPPRPFLMLAQDDEDEIAEVLLRLLSNL